METLETLQRKVSTTRDLYSIVRSMKSLAAVNIHQYQDAVRSLEEYNRAIDLGFQVLLRDPHVEVRGQPSVPALNLGLIVFGSDQGLCGQVNERVLEHVLQLIEKLELTPRDCRVYAVGERVATGLLQDGFLLDDRLSVPGSIAAITGRVQDLLMRIEVWHTVHAVDRVRLVHAKYLSRADYRAQSVPLLPFDWDRLRPLRERAWTGPSLPCFTMAAEELLTALIQQYLFIALYAAIAESLASENASRLAAMQRAEKNIEERLEELVRRMHQERQRAISEELLDIVSGFKALSKSRPG